MDIFVFKLFYFKVIKLEEHFAQQKYVNATEREQLAKYLGLTPTQIKIWCELISINIL